MPGTSMGSRLVLGQGSGQDTLDPFLALMHDDVPPDVMFPTHPHRGVEIITYGVGGALYHEDTLGNSGTVVAGGVERNLFGRGFAHSEQPVGGEHYLGFQLFILLSPEDREMEPSFQLLAPDEVPEVTTGETRIRVIAGEYGGKHSPLVLRNPTLYLDVTLQPGAAAALPIPADYRGLLYVLAGSGQFGSPAQQAGANQRLVLAGTATPDSAGSAGTTLRVQADQGSDTPLRFVLISGRPIFERRS